MSEDPRLLLVERFYRALATFDIELFWSVQTADVVYNISGHTPISGRIQGRDKIQSDILPPVFAALRMDSFRFATKWQVICADDHRIVCFMEADGEGVNGIRYDQRYVHIFAFRDGKISGLWEFFDTALANSVMFTPEADVKRSLDLGPFDFSR